MLEQFWTVWTFSWFLWLFWVIAFCSSTRNSICTGPWVLVPGGSLARVSPTPTAHTKWTRVEVGTRILLTWNPNNDGFCRCVGVPTTAKYALIEWLSIDSMAIQLSQDVGVFWIPQIYMFYWAKTWGWVNLLPRLLNMESKVGSSGLGA